MLRVLRRLLTSGTNFRLTFNFSTEDEDQMGQPPAQRGSQIGATSKDDLVADDSFTFNVGEEAQPSAVVGDCDSNIFTAKC